MSWWSKYAGLPFGEKGRGPDLFDCWGLFAWIFQNEKGITLPDYLDLYNTTCDRALAGVIEQETAKRWRKVDDPQAFDGVLLMQRGVGMHVGVVTKPGYMIHCEKDVNTVHERYGVGRWANKVMGFYRYE